MIWAATVLAAVNVAFGVRIRHQARSLDMGRGKGAPEHGKWTEYVDLSTYLGESSKPAGQTFSEEVDGLSIRRATPISGIQCSGKLCDNKLVYYRTDVSRSNYEKFHMWGEEVMNIRAVSTTPFFSEEDEPMMCPPGELVIQIACQGDYCDNMALKCARLIPDYIATDEVEEPPRPDGSGDTYNVDCPHGYFLAGIKCGGSYCKDLTLLCRKVQIRFVFTLHNKLDAEYMLAQTKFTGNRKLVAYSHNHFGEVFSKHRSAVVDRPLTDTSFNGDKKITLIWHRYRDQEVPLLHNQYFTNFEAIDNQNLKCPDNMLMDSLHCKSDYCHTERRLSCATLPSRYRIVDDTHGEELVGYFREAITSNRKDWKRIRRRIIDTQVDPQAPSFGTGRTDLWEYVKNKDGEDVKLKRMGDPGHCLDYQHVDPAVGTKIKLAACKTTWPSSQDLYRNSSTAGTTILISGNHNLCIAKQSGQLVVVGCTHNKKDGTLWTHNTPY